MHWRSYVAIGDSFTEGMNDYGPNGTFRGWADLVAARLAAEYRASHSGRPKAEEVHDFRYANLAIRGRLFDRIVDEQVPEKVLEWTKAHIHSPVVFLLVLNLVLLVLGSVLEIFSAIVILAPLLKPMADAYGIDPLHLGIIFLSNLELGFLFPPMGLNLILSSSRFNKPLTWRFAKLQARNLIRLCSVRIRVRGLEHIGGGPYVFTPNHQSHFDIAALLGHLPGCNRFAAKSEMFADRILGPVLRTMGMIPIDRDDPLAAMEQLNALKLDGFSVIIFPEGTRSPDGALLPFKKGAFVAAIMMGVPVVPVVCKGMARVMPKGKYLSILPGDVEVVVLEPIATAGMSFEDRDALRDTVRAAVKSAEATLTAKIGEADEQRLAQEYLASIKASGKALRGRL